MNTVGERPSRSHPATTSTQRCQPSTVCARSSRPRYRTIGRSVIATDRSGRRGFLAHASRSASLVGGRAKKAVVSKGIHSAPVATSTPSRSAVARGSVKNAGWRTSTAYQCDRGSRRRKPASVGTSDGLNDPGSWIQSAWTRGPSGSGVGQPALVRDGLRQLHHEPEVGTGLLRPGSHGVPGRRRVERGVPLDRVAPTGVGPQPLVCRGGMREEAALPGLVGPHRAPDMKTHHTTSAADCARPPDVR